MFEHPYFTQQVIACEQVRIVRGGARRRMLVEHAVQIVPRPAGPLRRLLRLVRGKASAPQASRAAACDPAVAR